MGSAQTAIIAILILIGIILFALGGFLIGMGGFNFSSGDSYENSLIKNLQDENSRLKVSNDKLQEQILLIQAENNRIRQINTQEVNNFQQLSTFDRYKESREEECDDIDDDIDDTRDDIDDVEEDIANINARISNESDPTIRAQLEAQKLILEDDLEELEDDLEELYDDEDDENC